MTQEKLPLPPRLFRRSVAHVREEIVSVLRHDLRNRIAAVRNSTFYIRKRVDTKTTLVKDDARIPQFFKVIDDELSVATASLETQLAAISGALATVNLAAFMPAFGEELGVTNRLDLELPSGSAEVRADEESLAVALHALLENAFEASPDGARVLLRLRHSGQGELALDVVDRGHGLGEGGAAAAMTPFFTTREGRLGVGLNIARRVVLSAGGRLELEPFEGGGVRATLLFPVVKEAA